MRPDVLAEVRRLRARVDEVQGRSIDGAVLPVHPALGALLPEGGLRPGGVYALSPSATLVSALLGAPTAAGRWGAVVGMPDYAIEAAADLGVRLDRLVLVPEPGPRWFSVVAALAEVISVVAIRPGGRVSEGEAARLSARLRDRGATLLVQGEWPHCDATFELADFAWSGVERGSGYLSGRTVTVSVHSRRSAVPRRARFVLPDESGALGVVVERADGRGLAEGDERGTQRGPETVPIRAVG